MPLLLEIILSSPVTRLVLWMIAFVIRPLRRRVLEWVSWQVSVEKTQAWFLNAYSHPPIRFDMRFDSKAPLTIKSEAVTLAIQPLGTAGESYIWYKLDEGARYYPLGDCDDIPPKGVASLTFTYTPPLYQYWNLDRIDLWGAARFRCIFGEFTVGINEHVNLDAKERDKAIKKLRVFYQNYFKNFER